MKVQPLHMGLTDIDTITKTNKRGLFKQRFSGLYRNALR